MVNFSVVIPVLNGASTLPLVLRCLEGQQYPHNRFECIVIDDGSSDDSQAILHSCSTTYDLTVRRNTTSLGRSGTRNIGVKEACGEWIVFLDADMLPSPRWLTEYSEAVSMQRDCAIISGARRCIDLSKAKNVQDDVARLANSDRNEVFNENVSGHFEALHHQSTPGQYPQLLSQRLESQLRGICSTHPESVLCAYSFVTSNVAVQRSRMLESGGFDPFLGRSEDTEIGMRLWEAGCRFGWAEGACAYHLYSNSESGRHVDVNSAMGLFLRHPYSLVLIVFLWSMLNGTHPEGASGKSEAIGTLEDIATLDTHAMRDIINKYGAGFLEKISPRTWRRSAEFLSVYLSETSGIAKPEIEELLRRASKDGVLSFEKEGKTYFDACHIGNWLRYHTTFEESCLRLSSYGRTAKTPHQRSPEHKEPLWIGYDGRYECEYPRELLTSFSDGVISVPLPVESDYQTDLEFRDWQPDCLPMYARFQEGVAEIPVAILAGAECKLGFSFSCRVHEVIAPSASDTDHRFQFLNPEWMGEPLKKAKDLLKKISLPVDCDEHSAARLIYGWILENTSYYETASTESSIVDTGLGSCLHQVSLFVNLCRLRGIPARNRCGALLSIDRAGTHKRLETRTRAYSPFNHSWAEIYIAGMGWISVDFVGWGYGKRLMTSQNVKCESLRRELENDTAMYDRYYFGCIDPYRIHVADDANKMRFLFSRTGIMPINDRSADLYADIVAHTRYQLNCEIRRSSIEGKLAV